MPVCRNVESPITAITGFFFSSSFIARATPPAMPSDAPMARIESIEFQGGLAPSV